MADEIENLKALAAKAAETSKFVHSMGASDNPRIDVLVELAATFGEAFGQIAIRLEELEAHVKGLEARLTGSQNE